jgi:hypothetical protein
MDVTVTSITFSGLENSESLAVNDDYTVSDAAFDDSSVGSGNRTVQMTVTLSTDPTSPVRNYTLTGRTGWQLANQSIDKIALTASHLNYALIGATYDGTPHGIAVPTRKAPHTGMGTTLTLYYTSTNGTDYPKSSTVPVNAGGYNVTADVTEGSIFDTTFDLLLGVYKIAPTTPTAAALAFTLSDATYDDRPRPVTVTPATGIEGLGAITVHYNGSTTVPVYPGTYTVTIDIAAGANYTAVTGLPAGAFTIYAPPPARHPPPRDAPAHPRLDDRLVRRLVLH